MAKEGNKRVTGKEQFYTPSETAFTIIENTIETFGKSILDHPFLEPAGGTGAFVNAAYGHGFTKIISYDIEPKHPMVLKADFLNTTLDLKNVVTATTNIRQKVDANNQLTTKLASIKRENVVYQRQSANMDRILKGIETSLTAFNSYLEQLSTIN